MTSCLLQEGAARARAQQRQNAERRRRPRNLEVAGPVSTTASLKFEALSACRRSASNRSLWRLLLQVHALQPSLLYSLALLSAPQAPVETPKYWLASSPASPDSLSPAPPPGRLGVSRQLTLEDRQDVITDAMIGEGILFETSLIIYTRTVLPQQRSDLSCDGLL